MSSNMNAPSIGKSKRTKLNSKEQEAHIEKWKQKLKTGSFRCPVPTCSKQFGVLSLFTQHLTNEAREHTDLFALIENVECPFCTTILSWEVLEKHINDSHKDVGRMLKSLKNGN